MGVVRNAFAGLGFDSDASMVVFPIAPFLVGSDLSPISESLDKFVEGLTGWKAAAGETGIKAPPKVSIQANGYEAAYDQMNRQFLASLWSDGLPLVPPTAERVDWILQGTDRPRDHIVGKVMPRGGVATMETVAVSLAMAGGRPEYLPVLTAALDAFLDPVLEHDKAQATSGSTFPVVIVNGPIAKQIRLNSGFGLLGPDPQHPAGASIGRALRLIQQNVGGALPGVGSMALYGGMRYTNAVFAEDEEGLPEGWTPVSVEHAGAQPGENALTVIIATGATNAMRRGVGKETAEDEALQSLWRVAGYLGVPNTHYTFNWATGTPGALLMPRIVARQLADAGWGPKSKVKQFLWDNTKIPQEEVARTGLRQWIEQSHEAATQASVDLDPWPISRSPDQIVLAVAGGAHPTHNFWMQAWSPGIAGRKIELPKAWDKLIATAEAELGACGDYCVIGPT